MCSSLYSIVSFELNLNFLNRFSKKYWNIRLHENPSSGRRVVPRGRADGQTTKLIVAFRDFEKALKIQPSPRSDWIVCLDVCNGKWPVGRPRNRYKEIKPIFDKNCRKMLSDLLLQDTDQWRDLDKNYGIFWVLKKQHHLLGKSANLLHGLWLNSRLQ